MTKIEKILKSILGLIICAIGLGVWYIDYLVFTAIGALTAWIAGAIGITGAAVLGLQVVGWILTIGTMVLLLFVGVCIIISGLSVIVSD